MWVLVQPRCTGKSKVAWNGAASITLDASRGPTVFPGSSTFSGVYLWNKSGIGSSAQAWNAVGLLLFMAHGEVGARDNDY